MSGGHHTPASRSGFLEEAVGGGFDPPHRLGSESVALEAGRNGI